MKEKFQRLKKDKSVKNEDLTLRLLHADQSTLVNWVKSMPEPPGEIRLVHGEAKARQALSGLLN